MSLRLALLTIALVSVSHAAHADPIKLTPTAPMEGDHITVEGNARVGPSTGAGECRATERVTRAPRAGGGTTISIRMESRGRCAAYDQPVWITLGKLAAGSYVVELGGQQLAFAVAGANTDP